MARKPYPSDLSDAQWGLVKKWIPAVLPGGRTRTVKMREAFNAILYLDPSAIRVDRGSGLHARETPMLSGR